ncbi:hypothetical protein [Undibacterium sp. Ren11W]
MVFFVAQQLAHVALAAEKMICTMPWQLPPDGLSLAEKQLLQSAAMIK